ncbi:coagulation factor IX isoform X1 [Synchiropus splendidus]|uniref:coagulation factor IX isoform X1 n=1 Tax=Synchiropus splendidus TaxID=270530 RepID=UPI00237DDB74|nr:coagulation factor IX isoform X1 [Synchiropus splendidus]
MIGSRRSHMSVLELLLLLCSLLRCGSLEGSRAHMLTLTSPRSLFLRPAAARQWLRSSASRWRRANSLLLEELLPGNLERECYEEACSQEEAAEIFQTPEKSLEFWFRYTSPDPCRSDPCQNGGLCSLERGSFVCLCPPRFRGRTCDSDALQCRYQNGGCMQYCRDLPGGATVQCGCADGYTLEADGRRCEATVAFPCGRQQVAALQPGRSRGGLFDVTGANVTWANVTWTEPPAPVNSSALGGNHSEWAWPDEATPRIVGGALEKRGGSPWQVLIRRADGYGFCGGTLVSDRWIVSAAHCFQEAADHVTIGDLDKQRPDPGEQLIHVQQVVLHPHFHAFTFDSDLALVLLARPVLWGPTAVPACLPDPHLSRYLLREGNRGLVTGWGATSYMRRSSRFLRRVALPVVSHRDCSGSTEQVITDNMFCAGFLQAGRDSCSGDSGGPFMVHYRGTWFLTGVVSWGERCAAPGKYGVYTRLGGNYLSWIADTMAALTPAGPAPSP